MSTFQQIVVIVLFALLVAVHGFRSGAPSTCSCPGCVPGHGGGLTAGFAPTVSRSPDDGSEYIPERTYIFTLAGTVGGAFFTADGGGSFTTSSTSGLKDWAGTSCPSGTSAITHANPASKTNPSFEWTAPSAGAGNVNFSFLVLPGFSASYQTTSLVLNEGSVNCSEADAAFCQGLNRTACGATADNTCGDCFTGYFGTEDSNEDCAACNEACAECTDNTTVCAVCASGYAKDANNECVETVDCSALPQTCADLNRNKCALTANTCGPCMTGFFATTDQDVDANTQCTQCNSACASCTNSSTQCVTCANGLVRNQETRNCEEPAALRTFSENANRLASDATCARGTCEAEVLWEFENTTAWFKISTTSYWASVGFGQQRRMDGDFLVALRDGTNKAINTHGAKPNRPSLDSNPTLDNVAYEVVNGRFTVVFSRPRRPINPDDDVDLSINVEAYAMLAWGSGSGDSYSYHGTKRVITGEPLQVGRSVGQVEAVTPTLARDSTIAHGVLMALAWLGFSPVGTYIARYGKGAGAIWFQLHRALQVVAFLLAIAGYAIILADDDVGESDTHHRMGHATIFLAIIQVLLGAFRNQISGYKPSEASDPDDHGERRWLFNYLHWTIGRALLIFAPITVFYGMDLLGVEESAESVFWAMIGLLLAFIVVTELLKCRIEDAKPFQVLSIVFTVVAFAGAVALAALIADTPEFV
eukprot:TRINITY_DN10698_c0_g2_i2.p1 TRINITY_DN10698_c0_g2~~TRINITY_DN10698_c0_g2_i2.p1  ORF type:complete len:704 (+),score=130.06 TRINITY_DN10698_c0_g2_i2:114-2225(+)